MTHHSQQPTARKQWVASLATGLVCVVLCGTTVRADQLTLRDLQFLDNVTVADFDVDGIRLVGNRLVRWDEVQSGKIANERQTEFDDLLQQLALPLYRIRWRLDLGDDEGLTDLTAQLLDQYRDRSSETAAMVWYAEFRGRIAQGDRAAAVVPLLALDRIRRSQVPDDNRPNFDRTQPSRFSATADSQTGLYSELLPVWFDPTSASKQWSPTYEFYQAANPPTPTESLYVASLAFAAGETSTGVEILGSIARPTVEQQALIRLLKLKNDTKANVQGPVFDQVVSQIRNYPRDLQAIAFYMVGMSRLKSQQPSVQQQGLLDLLRIPAEFPDVSTDLAGAALYETINALRSGARERQANLLQRELSKRFGQSWHARRASRK